MAPFLPAEVPLVVGLSKLAGRPGSPQTLKDFGVPARLEIVLPLAQLAGVASLTLSGTRVTGSE